MPDGEKVAKFLRLRGARLGPNGELIPVEIYGPPNPGEWTKAYQMFRTCTLMFDVLFGETSEMYDEKINKYAKR